MSKDELLSTLNQIREHFYVLKDSTGMIKVEDIIKKVEADKCYLK